MSNKELASKALDLTARGIDLLLVLSKVAQTTEVGALVVKEVGRWLGTVGLDEIELQFFLESTRALVRPNGQAEVATFFRAVTDRKSKPAIVPLWAQPSGALGRLVSSDPLQRWITSTVCCLFRYHDERFIKLAVSSLIMLASRGGQKPLTEYQLAYHPEMVRLEQVVSKVIHSTWIHIANSGIIGSDRECPRLPKEFDWACEKGHNIESHKLALVLSKLCDPPKEVIFQSEHLLANLVLWLTWHFNGHLRVVVSGSIVYDKVLGPAESTIECRVSKFCSKVDGQCVLDDSSKIVPTFQMLERIAGSLKTLFSGKYDSQQTLMSEPRVRKKLYQSPFRYPKGSQKSIEIQTQRTAQELLRWFVELPVLRETFGSRLSFRVPLTSPGDEAPHDLRVGDLLGRTPSLLNMYCGELGRTSVVFSAPREPTPPTVENFEEISDTDEDMGDIDDDDFEARPEKLLKYFPILQDLVDQVRPTCKCFHCSSAFPQRNFQFDENCLQHKAFMEVMFYFGHGIADALGATDVSGRSEVVAGDSGATAILLDLISNLVFDPNNFEGKLEWHTVLSTATQIFLGCPPLDNLTDATYNDSFIDTPTSFTQHLGASIVAVQYGDLAVVVPWLDLTQQITCRGCFRFEVVHGRLGLPIDEISGNVVLQEAARDVFVIETQHTEDVSDYAQMFRMPVHPAGGEIQLLHDKSEETCDFVLVSVGDTRYKLLMRVASGSHSRMVDPSMAILKVAHGVITLKCKHHKDRSAVIPDTQFVELYRFDELLGRWGSTARREAADEETPEPAPVLLVEGESTGKNISMMSSGETEDKPLKPLRVTHLLDSSFKYNTALALTGDDPVFSNSGDACLRCSLERVAGFETADWNRNYGRWVINKVDESRVSATKMRVRLGSSGTKRTIQDNHGLEE